MLQQRHEKIRRHTKPSTTYIGIRNTGTESDTVVFIYARATGMKSTHTLHAVFLALITMYQKKYQYTLSSAYYLVYC